MGFAGLGHEPAPVEVEEDGPGLGDDFAVAAARDRKKMVTDDIDRAKQKAGNLFLTLRWRRTGCTDTTRSCLACERVR